MRLGNALLSAWTWAEIGLMSVLGFAVQVPLFLVTWPVDRRRYLPGRLFRLVGVASAKLTPFWRFRVHGPAQRPTGRTVVVSNHQSNADPFLVSHLPWEMKWLGKASLFQVPIVGWMMWLAGDIPVHRGAADSARDALEKCGRWLERGMPVMIFPEGTRSTTEEMLPFKDGAFRLAIQHQAQLLPLAVSGTRKALPKHSWRFERSNGWVTVGNPISTQGMTLEDVDTLKAQAREQIEALRGRLRALD